MIGANLYRVTFEPILGAQHEGLAVPAGQKLYGVTSGDRVKVTSSLQYKGPQINDTYYIAIGSRWVGFDEIWKKEVPITLGPNTDFTTYTLVGEVLITEIGLFPWTPGWFDLYVKIKGYLGAGLPEYADVIEILLKPAFQAFTIVSYDVIKG